MLGNGAFKGCTGLRKLSVNCTALSAEQGSSAGWKEPPFKSCCCLDAVRVMLTKIPARMFAGCAALETLGLSAELKHIGEEAFRGDGLRVVTLPPSVQTIGRQTFADCPTLKEVRFGHALCRIGEDAFAGSHPLLVAPVVGSFARKYAEQHGLRFMTSGDAALQSEMHEKLNWLTAPRENGDREAVIFRLNKDLEELTIPATLDGVPVYAVGWHAFKGSSLKRVVLPEGLRRLEDGCFSDCTQLTSLTLPSTLQYIGPRAFAGCTALESVTLPSGLQIIDTLAFARCTALRSVDIPATVLDMGSWVFEKCCCLEKVVIRSRTLSLKTADHILTGVPHGLFDPLTIHAPAGSEAEKFAKAVRIRFRAL